MDEHEQFWLLCALLREQVYRVWDFAVHNAHNPTALQRFEAMQDVAPGKIVCETSLRGGDLRNSIGLLLEVGDQPRPDWDEAEDGPNLGERYWLIRTLDGRAFRWTNAMFVVVPEPAVHPRYAVRAIYDQLRSLWAQMQKVPDNPASTP
ncbi:hypothetical protein [Sulfobacillus harzensis]|uniref:Uncharacterized protein n=1 Tax=Sulfobacillus harzensis TaxID=2729629 RepID=A0A7Y0L7W1_9FIRM|nr:hypothetical protein [Sulfobacillus harzensis]NMP24938.1 hypothetical protein [Sulfobacillus harzensis]